MGIVSENEPITIVVVHFSQGLLLESLERAPVVYAADGGANLCMQYGCQPKQVIGDLDSLSPSLRSEMDPSRVIHVAEQDTTDFEKLLIRVDAPFMLAIGFMGGRIDHQMAVQTVLTAYAHRKIICVGDEDVMFVSPLKLICPWMRVPAYRCIHGPCAGAINGAVLVDRWPVVCARWSTWNLKSGDGVCHVAAQCATHVGRFTKKLLGYCN